MPAPPRLRSLRAHPLEFAAAVLRGFRANQGFLLASAIAYNTLLSIVPAAILILAVLSQLMPTDRLLDVVHTYVGLLAPYQPDVLTDQIEQFLAEGPLIGILGFLALLVFSALAFTVLENAMAVIFFHRHRVHRRHFLVSAVLPYLYIMLLGLGLLVVSGVSTLLHGLERQSLHVFGRTLALDTAEGWLIYGLGIIGELALLTSLYLVLPHGRIRLRHALAGAAAATALWEATRHVLVWWFGTLSFVNVIYGSFATVIVILLSLEVSAIILLLGAQVIAEYERLERHHRGQRAEG